MGEKRLCRTHLRRRRQRKRRVAQDAPGPEARGIDPVQAHVHGVARVRDRPDVAAAARSGSGSGSDRAVAEVDRPEGRSVRANIGVEFKGVSRSRKAWRSGIESEGWAERCAGESP